MTSRLYVATSPRGGYATRKRREGIGVDCGPLGDFGRKTNYFCFRGGSWASSQLTSVLQNVMLRGFSATDSVDELPSADFVTRGGASSTLRSVTVDAKKKKKVIPATKLQRLMAGERKRQPYCDGGVLLAECGRPWSRRFDVRQLD